MCVPLPESVSSGAVHCPPLIGAAGGYTCTINYGDTELSEHGSRHMVWNVILNPVTLGV